MDHTHTEQEPRVKLRQVAKRARLATATATRHEDMAFIMPTCVGKAGTPFYDSHAVDPSCMRWQA